MTNEGGNTVNKRFYSEVQVADLLGCNRATLRRWRAAGRIRSDALLSERDPRELGIPGRHVVQYDADIIDRIVAGEARLDRAEEVS